MTFDSRLGDHLRHVRQQKGLSLLDVEAASAKEFKASVLGAYERGDRAISVRRLARLAELYHVPLNAMLPGDGYVADDQAPRAVAVDLSRLDQPSTSEGQALARYVRALQHERGDWAGRILTIRREDLRALASALDLSQADLAQRLRELGIATEA